MPQHPFRALVGKSLAALPLAACAVLQGCASARIINVSWTPPHTYVDGAPLAENAIAGYELRCTKFKPASGAARRCKLAEQQLSSERNSTPVSLAGIPRGGGTYCFALATITTSNDVSAWTDEACKTFPPL